MLAIGNWGGGDADKEKLLTDIADDQVDLVSRAFMGLTVGCARCHDHKFDPISTRDYYALAGIFFSSHILENVGPKTNGPPMLRIPLETPAEQEARRQYAERMAALDAELTRGRKEQYGAFVRSLLPDTVRYIQAAAELRRSGAPAAGFAAQHGLHAYALQGWLDYLDPGGFRLLPTPSRNVRGLPGVHSWRGEADCPNVLINTTATELSILTFRVPPRTVTVHPGPTAGVAVAWRSPVSGRIRISGRVADADSAGGDGVGWSLVRMRAAARQDLASGEIPNGGAQPFPQGLEVEVRPGDEIQLQVLPKKEYTCDTTVVDLAVAEAGGSRVWDLARDMRSDPLRGNPHPDSFGGADVWRFYDMNRGTPRASGPAYEKWERALAAGDPAALEQAARDLAAGFPAADEASPFWIKNPADERLLPDAARTALAHLSGELETLRKNPPPPLLYANGAQEGGVPGSPHAGVHDVRVHIRGRYDRLGEVVPRGFPLVLAGEKQPPISSGSGRLELARWIAGPEHPLTARVMVNRVWQHLFGQGIVRTPNNFGKLGERPTHPELLDWLAYSFANKTLDAPGGAWSIKRLIREILLSSTYRQSCAPRVETLKADPDNRLLGRMNRKRLEAEAIRDSLLAVSGRLDETAGGSATRDFNSPRRSLYQMTVRSDRSGFGPLFDVADSTAVVDRRTESTVAPQALFMWNHPFVLEQARTLAARLAGSPGDDRARIIWFYNLLYARPPRAEEIRLGVEFLTRERMPQGVVPGGQPAADRAWEEYCLVLLCANEFIYVD